MAEEWGACFLDHYEQFFGTSCDGRSVFHSDSLPHAIQILWFDHIFVNCRTFCSLGYSHFSSAQSGGRGEVVMAVDDGFEYIPKLLGAALLYLAACEVPVSVGLSKGGLRDLDSAFVDQYRKEALYFTVPFPFPPRFQHVQCAGEVARMYLAVLTSVEEHEFTKAHGWVQFEQVLGDRDIDPFAIRRPTAISVAASDRASE